MAKIKVVIGTKVPSRRDKLISTPWGNLQFDAFGLVEVEVEEEIVKNLDETLKEHRMFIDEIGEVKKVDPPVVETPVVETPVVETPVPKVITQQPQTEKLEKVDEKKDDNEVDPLIAISIELAKEKVDSLRDMAVEMKLPKTEWDELKKAELIKYLAPKV